MARRKYHAIVVGSGPNGLAAAITFAQAGRSVLVVEAHEVVGGGTRSEKLTLPGFTHDVCAAVHPLGIGSPFFRTLPLEKHGLSWIHPPAPLAHPLDDGSAVLLERSVNDTAANLREDRQNYVRIFGPLVRDWPRLAPLLLGLTQFPRHPIAAASFGLRAMRSAINLAYSNFRGERARALFAGLAAHSILPLERIPTSAFGLILALLGHAYGWPFAKGGSQSIANALRSYLESLGGEVVTGQFVQSLGDLPEAQAILCDMTPRQLLRIASSRLLASYCRALERYRYGPGVCKVDWALSQPIPWKVPECLRAGTVHLGGTMAEIAESERAPWKGEHAVRPFVMLAQPTLFDPSRAPEGKHVAWAYCHVPNGSQTDMSQQIELQVERFATGFGDCILKRNVIIAARMEQHNPNLIGGDVNGGSAELSQLFLRPTWRRYRTAAKGIYLCSASTPPGGGVHGLCGHLAARAALRDLF
jgi:phytoene dehydrogenase-like protein